MCSGYILHSGEAVKIFKILQLHPHLFAQKKIYSLELFMMKPNNGSKDTSTWRVYMPQELREELVSWFHDSLNHAGVDGIYNAVMQHFWWQRMKVQIEECVKYCVICQKFRSTA